MKYKTIIEIEVDFDEVSKDYTSLNYKIFKMAMEMRLQQNIQEAIEKTESQLKDFKI